MLEQVISAEIMGIVYIISSILSLILVLNAPQYVKRYGNLRYSTVVLGAAAVLLFLLGLLQSSFVVVPLFILYFSLITLIYYGLDVFLERFTRLGSTGNTRGTYLTLGNLAWVGGPALVGSITAKSGFGSVYFLASAILCLVIAILFTKERDFHDTTYGPTTFKSIVTALRKNSDIRDIIILQGMLQFFFVWMVIYVPLYLKDVMGFGWNTIGTILSIMLLPFILFQYPVGKIVDRYHNEREVIFAGFLIMALATIFFAYLGVASVFAVALGLFLTRVGASITEVAVESYFFKKVDRHNIELIGAFRNMMPIAYLFAPIIAIIVLQFGSFQTLFTTLGVILSFVALFSLLLHDIKKSHA